MTKDYKQSYNKIFDYIENEYNHKESLENIQTVIIVCNKNMIKKIEDYCDLDFRQSFYIQWVCCSSRADLPRVLEVLIDGVINPNLPLIFNYEFDN